MPKLLHFVPCERIIKHEKEDAVSLITVLEGMTVNILPGAPTEDVRLNMRWSVFTHWILNHDEEPGRFTQHLQLLAPPDNKVLLHNRASFTLDREHTVRKIAVGFEQFPAPVPGIYWVMLGLQVGDEPKLVEDAVTGVPLTILHNHVGGARGNEGEGSPPA